MSPDVKSYRDQAPSIERIGTDAFITGFAWGVLTLAVLIAAWNWLA